MVLRVNIYKSLSSGKNEVSILIAFSRDDIGANDKRTKLILNQTSTSAQRDRRPLA